jgi:hypothetical protein
MEEEEEEEEISITLRNNTFATG